MKIKNKSGVTLIEMLVVIAIIAILVSVVMPVLTGQTNKAACAKNAANLRAIEGKVASLKTMYPQAFDEFIELGSLAGSLGSSQLGGLLDNILNEGKIQEGEFYIVTADADGNIVISPSDYDDSGTYTITEVPVSEKCEVGTDTVYDGVPMSVIISPDTIEAYYGRYTVEDFADIAKDGTYEGNNNPVECKCTNGTTGASSSDYKALYDLYQNGGKCTSCGHSLGQHTVTRTISIPSWFPVIGGAKIPAGWGACNHID